MSSLKAALDQIAFQHSVDISALAGAANRAASTGNRELCIELVAEIYQLADFSNALDSEPQNGPPRAIEPPAAELSFHGLPKVLQGLAPQGGRFRQSEGHIVAIYEP